MRTLVALAGLLVACSYAPRPGSAVTDDEPETDATSSADAPLVADLAIDVPPCPPPPGGCTVFECAGSTSCYYACATGRSWTSARDHCVDDQIGCLVTIDNAAENGCVFAQMAPIEFPDLVWFGFKQAQSQGAPDAGWSWQCDDSSFVAGNWGDFEPNDNSDPPNENNRENCGAMGDGGAWIDAGCSTNMRYVCELPR